MSTLFERNTFAPLEKTARQVTDLFDITAYYENFQANYKAENIPDLDTQANVPSM